MRLFFPLGLVVVVLAVLLAKSVVGEASSPAVTHPAVNHPVAVSATATPDDTSLTASK